MRRSPNGLCSEIPLCTRTVASQICAARGGVERIIIEGRKMRLKVVAWLMSGWAAVRRWRTTCMSVYRDALQQDPVYAAAKSTYAATKEKLPQGRALFLPNINATANATYNSTNINYDDANASPCAAVRSNYPSYGAGVNLTQPLFRPQNNALYDQAQIQVAQAESQLSFSGQELMIRVSQAYFDVLLVRVQPGDGARAEGRDGRAAGASQAQFPGRHCHHHRHLRCAGALRLGERAGNYRGKRHRGEAPRVCSRSSVACPARWPSRSRTWC